MSAWSTACWPRRGSASGWPSTGSTWPATPTPTATRPTSIAPCGPGATGSSRPSTPTCPTTSSSPGNWPATCLPQPTRAQVLATAFNRHHRQTNEGGSIEEEFRVEYVADRTNTFATAFLGLTLECARCHSHKYDPITQKEYYQLFGFFNSIDESGLYSHFTNAVPTPTLLLTSAEQDRAIAAIEESIKSAEAELDRLAEERRPAFEAWLKSPKREPVLAGLIGDFPLDALNGGKVANRADPKKPGQTSESPELVEGRVGKAIRLSGENNVTLPLGNFDRFEPFSLSLWIKTPDFKDRAVIIHRSMAWTDAGSRGYQLLIEDGKLSVGLIHFWPGNAIGIRAREPVPLNQWVHVAITYDGSSRAGGLALYVDGRRASCDVIRDQLTKNITGGGNDHLTVGQRFRDRGFKNGLVDEIKVFDRALTPAGGGPALRWKHARAGAVASTRPS